MSLLHQVNLQSQLPLQCHPQPCPPQLWPLLPSLNQVAPRSRTGRFRHPLAQSGWPGSGRQVLSIHLSSPLATRHLLVREAFGHLGLAVLRVRSNYYYFFLLLELRQMSGAVHEYLIAINIANPLSVFVQRPCLVGPSP